MAYYHLSPHLPASWTLRGTPMRQTYASVANLRRCSKAHCTSCEPAISVRQPADHRDRRHWCGQVPPGAVAVQRRQPYFQSSLRNIFLFVARARSPLLARISRLAIGVLLFIVQPSLFSGTPFEPPQAASRAGVGGGRSEAHPSAGCPLGNVRTPSNPSSRCAATSSPSSTSPPLHFPLSH